MKKRFLLIGAIAIGLGLLIGSICVLAAAPDPTVVSGGTWVYYDSHTFIRWPGVHVQIEDGSHMTTTSDANGLYQFSGVVTGTYTLIADIAYQCQCYHGVRSGVEVSGDFVTGKNVLLFPSGGCCKAYLPIIMRKARPIPAKTNPP